MESFSILFVARADRGGEILGSGYLLGGLGLVQPDGFAALEPDSLTAFGGYGAALFEVVKLGAHDGGQVGVSLVEQVREGALQLLGGGGDVARFYVLQGAGLELEGA